MGGSISESGAQGSWRELGWSPGCVREEIMEVITWIQTPPLPASHCDLDQGVSSFDLPHLYRRGDIRDLMSQSIWES